MPRARKTPLETLAYPGTGKRVTYTQTPLKNFASQAYNLYYIGADGVPVKLTVAVTYNGSDIEVAAYETPAAPVSKPQPKPKPVKAERGESAPIAGPLAPGTGMKD